MDTHELRTGALRIREGVLQGHYVLYGYIMCHMRSYVCPNPLGAQRNPQRRPKIGGAIFSAWR